VIREFRSGDAAGVVALHREVDPTQVVTTETILHRHRTAPPEARRRVWVVEADGRVVGQGHAQVAWDTTQPGVGEFGVSVAPAVRGRGIGGDLYDRAVSHLRDLGARTAGNWALPDGVAFLERRGHKRRRSSWKSALDLREADLEELWPLEQQKAAEGFRLLPVSDVLDRPRDLYELDVATSHDEPSDYPIDAMDYDNWLRTTHAHPSLRGEGSRVVAADDRLVAWALINTDGGRRAVNEFTGTRPELRGRGLARLAKLAVAAWARDNGVETLFTGNDAANAPMLAINRRMGYRPVMELHYLVRAL
jgi:GNAT superfamily N-acetyltransferase